MGGEMKKRKAFEEEEENEEEKIERFFGLVKSSREIRELLMMRRQDLKVVTDQARRVDPVVIPVWRPTFRPEDFGVAAPPRSSPGQEEAGPSSGDHGEVKRQNKGLDLDLNLSL